MSNLSGSITGHVAGDDLDVEHEVTSIPIGTAVVKAWFTVKASKADLDADAIVQIEITTVPASAGVISDDGAVSHTAQLLFHMTKVQSALCIAGTVYFYDIQIKLDTAQIYTSEVGKLKMAAGVTDAST